MSARGLPDLSGVDAEDSGALFDEVKRYLFIMRVPPYQVTNAHRAQ
jgi:hypothetical protein